MEGAPGQVLPALDQPSGRRGRTRASGGAKPRGLERSTPDHQPRNALPTEPFAPTSRNSGPGKAGVGWDVVSPGVTPAHRTGNVFHPARRDRFSEPCPGPKRVPGRIAAKRLHRHFVSKIFLAVFQKKCKLGRKIQHGGRYRYAIAAL